MGRLTSLSTSTSRRTGGSSTISETQVTRRLRRSCQRSCTPGILAEATAASEDMSVRLVARAQQTHLSVVSGEWPLLCCVSHLLTFPFDWPVVFRAMQRLEPLS